MTTLAEIYDRKFFEQFAAQNESYARACVRIAKEIQQRFAPCSLVDFGCGTGHHAAAFAALGVDVVAVDGVMADADLLVGGVSVLVADLAMPLPDEFLPARYDLSLCVDVLEHIADESSAVVLDNITRGADLLILSCAPPGQGGHHHVNERPRRYWVKRLQEIGWDYDRKATGAMERSFIADRTDLPQSWMYHNLCVYRRRPGPFCGTQKG